MATVSKLTDAQIELLKQNPPMIDIFGDINRDTFFYVRRALLYLKTKGSPNIDVIISSPGGNVTTGLDIYDLLRLYPGKISALIHDQAASMGAIILQACDIRRCAKHSSVLIHHISRKEITLDVLRSEEKRNELIEEMEKNQNQLYEILQLRTKKEISEIRKECEKDKYMNAEEAREFGLIDEIV